MAKPPDLGVIDTSSINEIRRVVPKAERQRVFAALDKLVAEGRLVFPDKVFKELERAAASFTRQPNPSNPDLPLEWTSRNRAKATADEAPFETVAETLAEVPEVCDVSRVTVGGVEDADPYVIAMATHKIAQGRRCTVITEDRRDRPDKMSLATACGVVGVPSVPLLAFLAQHGIWEPP